MVVDLPEKQMEVWNVTRPCYLTDGSKKKKRGYENKAFSDDDYEGVERVMDQFNNGTIMCPCEPACTEELYPASVTSVKWPGNKYKVYLYYIIYSWV